MGAAVGADGTPGPAVVRRTRAALRAGAALDDPVYIATGGARGGAPAEAEVIHRLLRARGVPDSRIVVEDQARDTLQSVVNCAQILRRLGATTVIVCTDRYHAVRCRTLFRLAGVATRAAPIPAALASLAGWRAPIYWLREAVTLPFDAALLLVHRLRER